MKKLYYHKLGRVGGKTTTSHYLTLPQELTRELGWKKGELIIIEKIGERIQLMKYPQKPKVS